MKPVCKTESYWKFWRKNNPHPELRFNRAVPWLKKHLRRAKRRFLKKDKYDMVNNE